MFKEEVQKQLLPKQIYYHYHISWLLQVTDCDYQLMYDSSSWNNC